MQVESVLSIMTSEKMGPRITMEVWESNIIVSMMNSVMIDKESWEIHDENKLITGEEK